VRIHAILQGIAALAVVAAGGGPARAQDDPHAACAAPPSHVPAEPLDRPVSLRDGIGNTHEVQRALRAIPGPDAWTQTLFLLESMARSAIEAGDWTLAEHTAAQMLDPDPACGGSHLAMALALRSKGDAARMASSLEAGERFRRNADPDLPELTRIAEASAPAGESHASSH
jgi:hypothetical protein